MQRKVVHFDSRDAEIVEFEVKRPSSECQKTRNREEDGAEEDRVKAKAYHMVLIKRIERSADRPMQLSVDDALERANLLERTLENDDQRHLKLRVQREDLALAWAHLQRKAQKQKEHRRRRDAGLTSTAQATGHESTHSASAHKPAHALDVNTVDPEHAADGQSFPRSSCAQEPAATKVTSPMRVLKQMFSRMTRGSEPQSFRRGRADETPWGGDRPKSYSRLWLARKRSRVQSCFDSISPVPD
eukprot:TRINITY_DN12721_c0_g2_i2.p1 TRINITY_DN12721_c0_g2~~TRINITY_DN12721_c0_g2_i2.p1  ORF type:complete len:244 (-),score=29.99 TRINITY_DN12721_c0_g2_i2:7-738(-)